MYRACIFDLDGTLANTLYSIAHFSNTALKQCGYPEIPDEDYRKIVGDGADMQIRRMLAAVCKEPFTEQEAAELKRVYSALYESDPVHLVREYPGMRETLAGLKRAGVPAAVLTNKPDAWAKAIIASLFPPESFELCFGQQPGLPRKPSPQGALMIAEKFRLDPREILYLGDTNTDMKTGAGAGMETAGVLWGFRGRRELEENGASYLLETPDEILPLIFGGKG
ncbi:HAD family hydrolase [Caproicibacter sp.]|uniref:HAD family hydrolase n=1 Tax=Caproicibacter sp. TaxID=2814884 RepID=UPI00398A0379